MSRRRCSHRACPLYLLPLLRAGFTGLALKLELSYGKPRLAVRIDRTQRIEYFTLSTDPTPSAPSEVTMMTVDRLLLPQLTAFSDKWRAQVCPTFACCLLWHVVCSFVIGAVCR